LNRVTALQRPVIFCDFDGTITVNDNIIQILKHFDPPGWEAIKDDILTQRVSIREGVGHLFSLLPASRCEEIVRYAVDSVEIRPGFAEFLRFCREEGIRFLVTSGGIDFFVYPILKPFGISEADIYCNGSDFSGKQIRITWPHPCDADCPQGNCGMCKTRVLRSYPNSRTKIVIGDSITDLAAAKMADLVIARDLLLKKCQDLHLPHRPFTTFTDVIEILKSEFLLTGGNSR
jgi:2-hydroxy-3-keto-5-methylthiopentenyl-1-phosphate phosphatase